MMIKAVLKKAGEAIAEFPIRVEGPGDFETGGKAAFDAFRKAFPDISLFDDDICISFDKLDTTDAQGS